MPNLRRQVKGRGGGSLNRRNRKALKEMIIHGCILTE